MCFPGREHISLGIRVSQVGDHISLGICVSQVGEHISLGICVFQVGKHISQIRLLQVTITLLRKVESNNKICTCGALCRTRANFF